MLKTVYEVYEHFTNEFAGHSALSNERLKVIDSDGDIYTVDYLTMGLKEGIEIHIIKDSKIEKEEWGITDDTDDEIGKHSGVKFKKVNCDLNEVDKNTERENE